VIDVMDKARYYSGELLERFKVIERNYKSSVSMIHLFNYVLRNNEGKRLKE
jgi:hypothetical protein